MKSEKEIKEWFEECKKELLEYRELIKKASDNELRERLIEHFNLLFKRAETLADVLEEDIFISNYSF